MQQKNLTIIDHPLLRHKLGHLRDKTTRSSEFRELVQEVSGILAYEGMRDWRFMEDLSVETPIAQARVQRVSRPPVVVAILRAGNGMLDGVLNMMPFASAGFIGIYRDKFIHNTVEYYFKLPADVKGRTVFVCDPLVATADTMVAAIDRLKSYEVGKIRVLSVLMSQRAVERLAECHPDVDFFTLEVEKEMNELGYLVPGLGDAGDRLYQTK